MADFRKWFFALAVVALLLGLGAPANAQINCTSNFVPTQVRAQGVAELVGDLFFTCTSPTSAVTAGPTQLFNFQVFLNATVTNKVTTNNITDALLIVNDPGSSNGTATTANLCNSVPAFLAPVTAGGPLVVQQGSGSTCSATSTAPPGTAAASSNIFQGQLNQGTGSTAGSANSIAWLGIPLYEVVANSELPGQPAGTPSVTTFTLRFTNIRVNASPYLSGATGQAFPPQILAFVSVSSATAFSIPSNGLSVANVLPGVNASSTTGNLTQCNGVNTSLTASSGSASPNFSATITEGFASAFKIRTSFTVSNQTVPGFTYGSESGLELGTTPSSLADAGTRLLVSFASVQTGTTVFVPNAIGLYQAGASFSNNTPSSGSRISGYALLVSGADATGSGGTVGTFSAGAPPATGLVAGAITAVTTSATYEVVQADPGVLETAFIPVAISFSPSLPSSPAVGTSTISVQLAPVQPASATWTNAGLTNVPTPRFVPNASAPANAVTIATCACNLLFPFITNQAGYETGIAIANTTTDPFRTQAQNGTVTLNFYGALTGGGTATNVTTSAPVASGNELVFTLSGGNSQFGITGANAGFQGYMIATANFQFCHGFAFISNGNVAQGYLALQLDSPIASPVRRNTGQTGGEANGE